MDIEQKNPILFASSKIIATFAPELNRNITKNS